MTTRAILDKTERSKAIAAGRRVGRKSRMAIFIFIGPALIYYTIFILYPLLATFYYSVNNIAPVSGKMVTTFVGLKNYIALFHDDIFFLSARNTILWGVVGPTIEMFTAITLAMVVYFKAPLHRFYRVAWFTPILVSGVIVGLVLLFGFLIIAMFFVRKSLTQLSSKSGIGLFGTAGLVMLIGAVLTIIVVGLIVIWIGLILATAAFFMMKEPQA